MGLRRDILGVGELRGFTSSAVMPSPMKIREQVQSGSGPAHVVQDAQRVFRLTGHTTGSIVRTLSDVTAGLGLDKEDVERVQRALTEPSTEHRRFGGYKLNRAREYFSEVINSMKERLDSGVRMELSRRAQQWWKLHGKTEPEKKPTVRVGKKSMIYTLRKADDPKSDDKRLPELSDPLEKGRLLYLDPLFKAGGGPHKYRSRKRIGGKWVYEYDEPKSEGRSKKSSFKADMDNRRDRGWRVTGNTYAVKDQIKALGGVWDSWEKQWLLPSAEATQEATMLVRTGGKSVEKRSEEASTQEQRTLKGWTVEGNTYPVKDRIRALGGTWDRQTKRWVMPSAEATEKARALLPEQPAKTKTKQAGEHIRTYETRTKPAIDSHVGELFRAKDGRVMKVTSQRREWVSEDGLSFGLSDDQGWLVHLRGELAAEDESKQFEQEEQARKRQTAEKQARREEKQALLQRFDKEGEYPQSGGTQVVLEGERFDDPDRPQNLYGGGEWFVVTKDHVWRVRNNGADGDDWSRSNVRTGGAGAIGLRLPKTPELEEQIRRVTEKST